MFRLNWVSKAIRIADSFKKLKTIVKYLWNVETVKTFEHWIQYWDKSKTLRVQWNSEIQTKKFQKKSIKQMLK